MADFCGAEPELSPSKTAGMNRDLCQTYTSRSSFSIALISNLILRFSMRLQRPSVNEFRLTGSGTVVLFTALSVGSTFLLNKTMIQLQLQETSGSKTKSGPAPGERVLEMSYMPVIALVIAAVLGLGFNSASGHRLGDQAQAAATRQGAQADSFKHRMDVIQQLCDRQAVRPNFLNQANAKRKDSSAVWLNRIRDEGDSLAIEGMAITPNAVSGIISDLQSTGYFRNIEIKETYRDDSQNKTHTFEFQLTCQFKTDRY